jgi:pyruvate,water dikinase
VIQFKTLDDLVPGDRARVGGKAFNCSVLKRAGLPVPDGLVVPSDASDADVTDLTASRWVRALPADARLAVRSSGLGEDSADHSFAGMHDTRLGVGLGELIDAVRACRTSSGSAQARAYRAARALDGDEARIGVLVQLMVPAVVSGVAFTINPLNGANEMVINAAAGLGEDLVSGRVDPDEFRVDKNTGDILGERRGTGASGRAATLTHGLLRELVSLLTRIESHYSAPQDVEWCHDGRQFWIVQSRPVTTRIADAGVPRLIDERHPETEWTRANLAEVFPDLLSPQVLAVYEDMLNRGQRMFMGRLLAPDAELGPMFKSFRGRLYMNLSQMRRVVWIIGAPAAGMLRSLGHPEAIRSEDELPRRAPLGEILRCVPDLLRLAGTSLRAPQLLRKHEQESRELVTRLAGLKPAGMSDREMWAVITNWVASAPAGIQIVFVMSGVLPRETALRKATDAAGFSYERLVYPQLAAGRRSVSSQQAFDLVALANVARQDARVAEYFLKSDGTFEDVRDRLAGTAFLDSFDRFLDAYGHRGRYESDWSLPRLHEDPAPALFAIRSHLQTPERVVTSARQLAEADAAWREFDSRLSWWQRLTLAPRVRRTLRDLKQQYLWREQVRSDLTRALRYLRRLHLALADRFVERGWLAARDDYFLLTLDEIRPAIDDPRAGPGLRIQVTQRQSEVAAMRAAPMPYLIGGGSTGVADATPPAGNELTGLCVSPGLVEAEVVVMRDPGEFASMRRGAILVAPATDPSWTPLFTLASGVIVEIGGMLSHASTIAREYGLPALANVKDATTLLKTGERVTLDASSGRVRRHD